MDRWPTGWTTEEARRRRPRRTWTKYKYRPRDCEGSSEMIAFKRDGFWLGQVGDGPACRDGLGEVFGGGSKVWVECLSRLANGSSDAGALVGEQPATVRGQRAGTVLQALRVLEASSFGDAWRHHSGTA